MRRIAEWVMYTVAATAVAQIIACAAFGFAFVPGTSCGSDVCAGLRGDVLRTCRQDEGYYDLDRADH